MVKVDQIHPIHFKRPLGAANVLEKRPTSYQGVGSRLRDLDQTYIPTRDTFAQFP